MGRSRNLLLAAGAVAVLTFAACSEEDQNNAEDTANSLADRAENAANSIADQAGDVAATAVSAAQNAAEEATQDAAETLVRNLAAQQGEEQFADAGHPLDSDGLTCEATAAEGLKSVDVNCTGTTEDGGAAELTGTTDELPGSSVTEIKGTFKGTVDGAEVFTSDTLGG
jgi:hypothetical protein